MRPRQGKFNARRTQAEGIWFHSGAEAARYLELRLLEKAGEISALVCQPRFPLYAQHTRTKIGDYVADFGYYDHKLGKGVIEDIKGMKTLPLAKWKQKHLFIQEGIVVTEVRKSSRRGA